jgi:hypothetical protein
MNALLAQLAYRSKAVVIAVAAILATAAVAALQDPSIQAAVVHLIPVAYQPVAVLVIGAVVTAVVHQIPLGAKPATATDEAPVTELADSPATTMIPTIDPTAGH